MEWILQLADEFDDAIGMIGYWLLGAVPFCFAAAGAPLGQRRSSGRGIDKFPGYTAG